MQISLLRTRRAALVAAGTIGVLTLSSAAVGVTYAAAPTQQISACSNNRTGALRVLRTGQRCRSGETRLDWNKTGPRGRAGAKGPAGPRGPKGDPGVPGTRWHTVRFGFDGMMIPASAPHIVRAGRTRAGRITIEFDRSMTGCPILITPMGGGIMWVDQGVSSTAYIFITTHEGVYADSPLMVTYSPC